MNSSCPIPIPGFGLGIGIGEMGERWWMNEMLERVCGVSVGEVLLSGEGREENVVGLGDKEELEGFNRVDMTGTR